MSDIDEAWTFSTNFREMLMYQISLKHVH